MERGAGYGSESYPALPPDQLRQRPGVEDDRHRNRSDSGALLGSVGASGRFTLVGGKVGPSLRGAMSTSAAVVFDPFDPEQIQDPYPGYRWLRDEARLHYVEMDDLWLVSRYDCMELLRNPSTFSSRLGVGQLMSGGLGRRAAEHLAEATGPLQGMAEPRILIALDPPDHVRLRRLVNRPFTPREIGAHESWMRPLCEEIFDGLLDANAQGDADWVRDFTFPFPVMVIGKLLGIPSSLGDDFKRWSDDVVGLIGGPGGDTERMMTSFIEMLGFFHEAIASRRSEPTDDLISMLIHNADAEDEPLTADELVLFCVLLLVAGNETTTNLLSNAMKVFTSMPEILAHLRSDPAVIPAAVEEVLRFDSPVRALPRGTTAPVSIAGGNIPADATVVVYYGAANRDERRFPDPDRFDVGRIPADHVGFGAGIHLCLGAPLARLEARIVLETLVRRAGHVELSAAPILTEGALLRGASSMPIGIEAS
jgi:cytochrome P450